MELTGIESGQSTFLQSQGNKPPEGVRKYIQAIPEEQRSETISTLKSFSSEQRAVLQEQFSQFVSDSQLLSREQSGAAFVSLISEISSTVPSGEAEAPPIPVVPLQGDSFEFSGQRPEDAPPQQSDGPAGGPTPPTQTSGEQTVPATPVQPEGQGPSFPPFPIDSQNAPESGSQPERLNFNPPPPQGNIADQNQPQVQTAPPPPVEGEAGGLAGPAGGLNPLGERPSTLNDIPGGQGEANPTEFSASPPPVGDQSRPEVEVQATDQETSIPTQSSAPPANAPEGSISAENNVPGGDTVLPPVIDPESQVSSGSIIDTLG